MRFRNVFHLRKIELENILLLLDNYHRTADFQINHRLIVIEQLKEKMSIYMHKIADNSKDGKENNKVTLINMLSQIIIIEEDSLIAFLMGIKGRIVPTHTKGLIIKQNFKYS